MPRTCVSAAAPGLPDEPRLSRRSLLAGAAAAGATFALPGAVFADVIEDDEPPRSILSLPFVRDTTRAERKAGLPPRLFWSVQPTGNYGEDCETGSSYAKIALDYMTRENSHQVMQWAVFDMMRAGPEHSGIEVGFLSVFGQMASGANRILHMSGST